MSTAEHLSQEIDNREASYALTSLLEFYERATLFVEIGLQYGFKPDASFENFETMADDYLATLGDWINHKQLVNATWHEDGALVSGGFIGLNYDVNKTKGVALDLQVVADHDQAAGVRTITASQLLDLAPAKKEAPPVRFVVGKKQPASPPGKFVQTIIEHYTSGDRAQLKPPATNFLKR